MRLSKFFVFFYRLKYICHQNTPKLYLLFLLWAFHPKTCITKASKICKFFRYGLHPYKLARLRATIGLIITSCYRIKLIKIKGHNSLLLRHKAFVARNKFPHVEVACNTKKLGRPGLGPQGPSGPPTNCGPHRLNCRYMISSLNIRQQFMS